VFDSIIVETHNFKTWAFLFSIMNKPTNSPNYRTVRIAYPEEWHLKCPLCGQNVRFMYSNAGKLVHCLDEDVYQILNLYQCSNTSCELSQVVFNPAPRYDYGGRLWGVDVLRYIGKKYLKRHASPQKILEDLEDDHPHLQISKDSVARICDDLLELKAFRIDERTHDIIHAQNVILLGFDGQDPGGDNDALWLFIDMISGRILASRYFESLSHQKLHEYLEDMLKHYGMPVCGWVSDKQNVITKCHDTYYTAIPHQYCQFHFLQHLWNHLECLDSGVFMPLKQVITHLYIHTTTNIVDFEGKGKLPIKAVFKQMDEDLQTMVRVRNISFKELRGLWLYETITTYLEGLHKTIEGMTPGLRVTKILIRTETSLRDTLDEVTPVYQQVKQLSGWFQQIRTTLKDGTLAWQDQQQHCDKIFQAIWTQAGREIPHLKLENCKSFLARKSASYGKILGEWCRLWNSYLPGLFQYVNFPGQFRTNGPLERLFSGEKCAFISRVGKGNVGHMIATRGEAYLRITHCDVNELEGDINVEYREELVKALRSQLRARITAKTARWRTRDRVYQGFLGIQWAMEPNLNEKTKMEVR
jgi:hypothetical protein